MKTYTHGTIIKNTEISSGIYEMVINTPEIAREAKPGQFVNLYTGRGEMLLPRPISICEIDTQQDTLRLLYQTVGKGTLFFSSFQPNETIQMLGPLGNGFTPSETEQVNVVIGGGIGVPPLLELCKYLKGEIHVFIGARSHPILADDFSKLGTKVYIATDDGSVGYHGNAVELLYQQKLQNVGAVYACGPKPMLQAVKKWADEIGVNPQISMEERMACGIGACVGCTTKILDTKTGEWSNLKICKDGPVFLGSEVIFGE